MSPNKLSERPLHLGLGATAEIEPVFTGDLSWYESYAARHADDGVEGRLVSLYTFDESWDVWEMHPKGAEVVVCTAGDITLIQETPDGKIVSVHLTCGEFAVNDPGVWHTADIDTQATVLFITAGMGTAHRPRGPISGP